MDVAPDLMLAAADRALRTVFGSPSGQRPYPSTGDMPGAVDLSDEERRHSAALMRVNHVGEVCAQALYEAQAIGTPDPRLRELFLSAAREEIDHLAWTQRRIGELGGRASLLNPLWFAGAFAIGLAAARMGDRVSLGFMAETERQVEAHLDGHLLRLAPGDLASRAVIERMKEDEVRHADTATDRGGTDLPLPARLAMKLAARVMTATAHYI
ncbi:MAG: 2-polyprenyl-3-methyl-6-methoxy-1,4-benzoquinone monooxygenase [Betaproteobacteria bacterium]|jgi:ubiquinone biosynthesis monooxygenase Coq7